MLPHVYAEQVRNSLVVGLKARKYVDLSPCYSNCPHPQNLVKKKQTNEEEYCQNMAEEDLIPLEWALSDHSHFGAVVIGFDEELNLLRVRLANLSHID